MLNIKEIRQKTQQAGITQPMNDLTAVCVAYRMRIGGTEGTLNCLKYITNALWPENGHEPFIWHPWAEDVMRALIENRVVSLMGCGASSKTNTVGIKLLIDWMVNPSKTQILVMSTTLEAGQKRIWKPIANYFRAAEQHMPGALLDNTIKTYVDKVSKKYLEGCGIHLIAIKEKSNEQISSEVIGARQANVILCADEYCEMNEGIFNAYRTNVIQNPYSQFICTFNPISFFDPATLISEPKNGGWNAVNPNNFKEDKRYYAGNWKTIVNGICLHFNAEYSPNNEHIIEKETTDINGEKIKIKTVKWPFLSSKLKIDETMEAGTLPSSPDYYRMYKGFPFAGSSDNFIYSPQDLERANAFKDVNLTGDIQLFAGADISYTTGGDKTVIVILQVGRYEEKDCIRFHAIKEIQENVELKDEPRDYQIVRKLRQVCDEYGVPYSNFGFDSTGAGLSFASIVRKEWSNECQAVEFGGAASENIVFSATGEMVKAKDKYENRVSELWFSGVELFRDKRVYNLNKTIANQLCARKQLTPKKSGNRLVYCAESKKNMRERIRISPDHADAFFIALNLILKRGIIKIKSLQKNVNFETNRILQFSLDNNLFYSYDDVSRNVSELLELQDHHT